MTPGIINSDLPRPNKFCNFFNISTTTFDERKKRETEEIVSFLQNNYLNTKNSKYIPTFHSFTSNFIGNNIEPLISTYYKPKSLIHSKSLTVSEHKDIIGIMTTKCVNITLKEKYTFKANYVDHLCINSDMRKQDIAPTIIQTHEYIARHKYKNISVSLFKSEGKITGIVPLTTYMTAQFDCERIKEHPLPHASMRLIEINKLNLSLFMDIIASKKKTIKCYVLSDFGNILNLINTNNIKIYGIIQHNILICVYLFRDSFMDYNGKKAIEFFGSLSNCPNNAIFINGFTLAINKYKKISKASFINIETISDNYIIKDYLYLLYSNTTGKNILESPSAYFFYNYRLKTIQSKDVFILT